MIRYYEIEIDMINEYYKEELVKTIYNPVNYKKVKMWKNNIAKKRFFYFKKKVTKTR